MKNPFRWLRSDRADASPPPDREAFSSFADFDSPIVQAAYRQMDTPRRDIEVVAPDAQTESALMSRVLAQWQKLGSAEPFWSNSTTDIYRADQIDDATKAKFYERGENTLDFIAAFESRAGVTIANGTCLDFGCGVGRIIAPLARRFAKVVGVDVSTTLLEHCRAHAASLSLANVETVLLTSPDVFDAVEPLDFFVSISVLQHNPPPVQRILLEKAFAKIKPGGFCLFQTPDWLDGYTFRCRDFLQDAPEKLFDLHCLPKPDVLRVLCDSGMEMLDFAPDFVLQQFGSYFYFARKRGA